MTANEATSPGDRVTILGDPTHLWSYARYGMVLAFFVAVIADVVFAVQGGVHWYNLLAAAVGTPVIFGLVLGLVCLSWKRRVLPVSYRVNSDEVTVLRDGMEVARYARIDIESASFVSVMDYRSIITRLTYNPSWPQLRLGVTSGVNLRLVDLPEVMIWGREEVHEAERAVRAVLSL
jgi:hypothetical protein